MKARDLETRAREYAEGRALAISDVRAGGYTSQTAAMWLEAVGRPNGEFDRGYQEVLRAFADDPVGLLIQIGGPA